MSTKPTKRGVASSGPHHSEKSLGKRKPENGPPKEGEELDVGTEPVQTETKTTADSPEAKAEEGREEGQEGTPEEVREKDDGKPQPKTEE